MVSRPCPRAVNMVPVGKGEVRGGDYLLSDVLFFPY